MFHGESPATIIPSGDDRNVGKHNEYILPPMNSSSQTRIAAALVLSLLALAHTALASGGATDPIPGTSKSGLKSGGTGGGGSGGGGGGKTVTPTPTPTPTPAPAPQPIVVAPLAFTPVSAPGGIVPVCSGSYRIDPYYPTLSLMTVNVQTSSVGEADGSLLFITVNVAGGTAYPFVSNAFLIVAGSGIGSVSEYITPGTTVTSVDISDAFGTVLLTGN